MDISRQIDVCRKRLKALRWCRLAQLLQHAAEACRGSIDCKLRREKLTQSLAATRMRSSLPRGGLRMPPKRPLLRPSLQVDAITPVLRENWQPAWRIQLRTENTGQFPLLTGRSGLDTGSVSFTKSQGSVIFLMALWVPVDWQRLERIR